MCFAKALINSRAVDSVLQGREILKRLEAFSIDGEYPTYLDEYPRVRPLYQPKWEVTEWNPQLGIGPQVLAKQIDYEPEPTLQDFYMAACYDVMPSRLKRPHRLHLLLPLIENAIELEGEGAPLEKSVDEDGNFRLAWGTLERVHTLVSKRETEEKYFNLYWDYDKKGSVLVNGKKATLFRSGDSIEIRSGNGKVSLVFEGNFCGHISRGNRIQKKGVHSEAFDWRIAIRGGNQVHCKVGLSLARPMACMPLST